jgi:hypothetical protein
MEIGFFGDFAKQFIVASGSIAAGYCMRSVVDLYHKRTFRRAFGQGVQRPTDIVISVPLWRALEHDRSVPRFLKADSFGARDEYYGPSEMYNVDDMGAAASVLSIIANYFPQQATYTNDAAQPDWNAKTVIIIGSPIANFHARRYIYRYMENHSIENIPSFEEIIEDSTTGARTVIRIPGKDEPKRSSIEKDYGLLLRLPNIFCADGKHFVFILAGIHAASTREAARLLRELWPTAFPRNGIASFVFEMEANMVGTGRIIHECP